MPHLDWGLVIYGVASLAMTVWALCTGRLRRWWDDRQARRILSRTGKSCPFCGGPIICLGVSENGEDLLCQNSNCLGGQQKGDE